MQKCAYERYLHHHHHRPFTEQEISQDFFNCSVVPDSFDGLGLFSIKNIPSLTGISKDYSFLCKPIQELLAALYPICLKPADFILKELSDTFGKKGYEMVWVFYAGLTDLKQLPIDKVLEKHKMPLIQQHTVMLPARSLKGLVKAWIQCHNRYMQMTTENLSMEFLLSLILCCYEARNREACKVIADHLYADKVCHFEIPPNHATPYLLLAVSYFIFHSGKIWSLRCNIAIQSSIELLFTHINDPNINPTYLESPGCLWVLCCVVASSEIQ